jgi:hypothetical protein
MGRDVAGALAGLGLSMAEVTLGQGLIYAESASKGLSVFEEDPKSEAAREIISLARCLIHNEVRAAA